MRYNCNAQPFIRNREERFYYLPYDDSFTAELKPFLDNLEAVHGHLYCEQAFRMAERLQDNA